MDVLAALEKVSPILAHYPRPLQWLFIASFTMVLGSLLAFGIGYGGAARRRAGMTADGTLPSLIEKARNPRAGTTAPPYLLESVVMTVKLTSRPRTDGLIQTAQAEAQFVYTVFALEDVPANQFNEFAHTNVKGAHVAWIAGSEKENVTEPGPGAKSWTLAAPIAKGQRRTFLTAARYSYLV